MTIEAKGPAVSSWSCASAASTSSTVRLAVASSTCADSLCLESACSYACACARVFACIRAL
eukprot:6214014-Pleurochrysis_carterae.AAC.2